MALRFFLQAKIMVAAGLDAKDVNYCMDKAEMLELCREAGVIRAGDNPDPQAFDDILASTPRSSVSSISCGPKKAAPK